MDIIKKKPLMGGSFLVNPVQMFMSTPCIINQSRYTPIKII